VRTPKDEERPRRVIAHFGEKNMAQGDVRLMNCILCKHFQRHNAVAFQMKRAAGIAKIGGLVGITLSRDSAASARAVLAKLSQVQAAQRVPTVVVLQDFARGEALRKEFPKLRITAVLHSTGLLARGRSHLHEALRHALYPED
jgi:hypothetical protein